MNETVLMLLDNPFNSDNRVEREISSLIADGYNIDLICWDREIKYPDSEIRYENKLKIFRIKHFAKKGKGIIYLFIKYFLLNIAFVRESLQRDFDIIHCHNLATILAGRIIKFQKNKPLIYDAHEVLGINHYRIFPSADILISKIEKILASRANAVLVVTEGMEKLFKERGYKNRLQSVENFPLKRIFHSGNYENVHNSKVLTIGRIGSISSIINANLMVKIAGILISKGYKIKLVFAGPINNDFNKEFMELINNHKEYCEYWGEIPSCEIPDVYKKIDISLNIPDIVEEYKYGYPSKVFEAMAAGIPSIQTESGEVKNVLQYAQCGILFKDLLIEKLIEVFENLISNEKYRTELGMNGRRAFINKYNWENISDKFLDIYKYCLK